MKSHMAVKLVQKLKPEERIGTWTWIDHYELELYAGNKRWVHLKKAVCAEFEDFSREYRWDARWKGHLGPGTPQALKIARYFQVIWSSICPCPSKFKNSKVFA